jgi:molybdopterin-guanine dinucleotide biosynthesis adapter protein
MKVLGFAGFSGSGKTTLIEQVIPILIGAGISVSLIKHAHHSFDVDQPGKDSHRHRAAGCTEVLVTSSERWALLHELRGGAQLTLDDALARLRPCDLALVEGFKHAAIPKIEVHRAASGYAKLFETDAHVVAIATDERLDTALPQLDLNRPDAVAQFVLDYLDLRPAARRTA